MTTALPPPNTTARRFEHQQTDRGYVPVYTTSVVEQPWSSYSTQDHQTWAPLYRRQRELLPGRACREFLDNLHRFGIGEHAIPKFDELNRVLRRTTGWTLVGVEGLLPEFEFFDHLANRRFPVTWWIRRPDQIDYIAEPDLFHDLYGHVPLLLALEKLWNTPMISKSMVFIAPSEVFITSVTPSPLSHANVIAHCYMITNCRASNGRCRGARAIDHGVTLMATREAACVTSPP